MRKINSAKFDEDAVNLNTVMGKREVSNEMFKKLGKNFPFLSNAVILIDPGIAPVLSISDLLCPVFIFCSNNYFSRFFLKSFQKPHQSISQHIMVPEKSD